MLSISCHVYAEKNVISDVFARLVGSLMVLKSTYVFAWMGTSWAVTCNFGMVCYQRWCG
jgi:hypothetical protein